VIEFERGCDVGGQHTPFGVFKSRKSSSLRPFSRRVLELFQEMDKDRLDLHALFEAGGNEPLERIQVLDAIEDLIREGLLEASGSDFYGLTERGKKAISR
jgi:hypothetical protein